MEKMEEIVRKHIVFYGRVQGVGFRYRSHYAAEQFGLTGWVRNRYDGTVEMEIQGKRMCIDAMLRALEQNDYVQIDDMDARMLAVEAEERSFRIID